MLLQTSVPQGFAEEFVVGLRHRNAKVVGPATQRNHFVEFSIFLGIVEFEFICFQVL